MEERERETERETERERDTLIMYLMLREGARVHSYSRIKHKDLHY